LAKITFGILALNAQPLLEYNLRALYPYAYEIIVVEGATRPAASLAGADGHSGDGTLKMLELFKKNLDLENKLQLVSAADDGHADGFWPEKDEMSQAFAKRAGGDWLWQVDSDEFYRTPDIETITRLLDEQPNISGISFPFYEFWGGFDYFTTGTWYKYEFTEVRRLFRWQPGYSYSRHRPPTVLDEHGRNLDLSRWVTGKQMRAQDIFMYHYSYVFPKQSRQKVGYYSNVDWTDAFRDNSRWLDESYVQLKHPMFLGDRGPELQWLERFEGEHPETIQRLRRDLGSAKVNEPLRWTEDIERLLASPVYYFERMMARVFLAIFWPLRTLWKKLRNRLVIAEKAT